MNIKRQTKNNQKIAQLGKPSLIWGYGQQKRLALVKKHFDFKDKKVLDIGCGLGLYSQKFFEARALVWGVDVNRQIIEEAKKLTSKVNFLVVLSGKLPLESNFFDLVFLNEVLEHVEDDQKTIDEALRVLKPGGKIIIFAPNRLFPFETHGIYLGRKYIYKNIPLINWLPLKTRNIFCPHVRIYTIKTLKNLFVTISREVAFEKIDYIWPAFDKIERKIPLIGQFLKKLAQGAEKNSFFKKFGISIFMVAQKQ